MFDLWQHRFSKNGKLTSLLITYVRMKDNWHGSIERYMLNEDDLRIYSLLFREMEYSINRMEANDKIYMMNRKLRKLRLRTCLPVFITVPACMKRSSR